MTDQYLEKKAREEFDKSFTGTFRIEPRSLATYEPQAPRAPWYLDPESGGPNPPADERKPGIAYDDQF